MNTFELAAHTVFATAVLAGYCVLTALGHDANALLGVLAGQGVGVAVTSKIPKP